MESTLLHKSPARHLSIRVPWHDSDWVGCVCSNPRANTTCLALDRIRLERNDDDETAVAGKLLNKIPQEHWPVCVAERDLLWLLSRLTE